MKVKININKELYDIAVGKGLIDDVKYVLKRYMTDDEETKEILDKLLQYTVKLSFEGQAMRRYRDGLLLYRSGEDFQGVALDLKMVAFVKNVSIYTVEGWITRGLPVEQDREAGNIRIYPHILDQWLEAENIRA